MTNVERLQRAFDLEQPDRPPILGGCLTAPDHGRASLVFLTNNAINPDCPLENIRAFWDAARASAW
jgi:hypothetical protein